MILNQALHSVAHTSVVVLVVDLDKQADIRRSFIMGCEKSRCLEPSDAPSSMALDIVDHSDLSLPYFLMRYKMNHLAVSVFVGVASIFHVPSGRIRACFESAGSNPLDEEITDITTRGRRMF